MILYFLRHGHAEDGHNIPDHDRQLTSMGKDRIMTAGRLLAEMGIAPQAIYTSPRVRARQTADLIGTSLQRPVEAREEVDFGFNLRAVEALITGHEPTAEVIFVGHEPFMSEVIGELTGGTVVMKKGSLARVDLTSRLPLHGELVWLIAPRVFDALDDEQG